MTEELKLSKDYFCDSVLYWLNKNIMFKIVFTYEYSITNAKMHVASKVYDINIFYVFKLNFSHNTF